MNRFLSKIIYLTFVLIIGGFLVMDCAMSGAGTVSRAMAADHKKEAGGSLKLVSLGTGDMDNMTIRARQSVIDADIVFTMGGRTDYYGALLEGKTVYDAGHRLFATDAPGQSGHKSAKQDVKKKKNKKQGAGHWRHKTPEQLAAQREKTRRVIRDAVAAGKHVVIIDNGDPTIFGPHVGYMREFADLNPQIVPGISSFNAANAALHTSMVAGKSMAVTLTIGRLGGGRDKLIAGMINGGQTLAFFMVRDLNGFISTLTPLVPADTPVAIVSWAGSREKQRVIRGSVGTILTTLGGEKVQNYLLYVGTCLKSAAK